MPNAEQSYTPVSMNSEKEDTEDGVFDRQEYYSAKKRSRTNRIASFLLRLVALVLAAAFVFKFWDIFSRMQRSLDHIETEMMDLPVEPGSPNHPGLAAPHPQPPPPSSSSPKKCVNPERRPAWHELSIPQRLEYIEAVKCLATKDSYINPNSTLYDDYTWMHIMDGDLMHFAAPNLPWHRWHLYLYEWGLKEQCGYSGRLPFWDWEQPDQGIIDSDFFHPVHGFGGSSSNETPYKTNDKGVPIWDAKNCLGANGPFESLRPQWSGNFNEKAVFNPHCLTRLFADQFVKPHQPHMMEGPKLDLKSGKMTTQQLHYDAKAMQELLAIPDYNTFNLACEELHTWAAKALMGEYLALQAPNDPTFFPHLAKIDQLWYRWQQKDNQKDLWTYNGASRRTFDDVPASLDDVMVFHTFPGMEVVRARDVMNAEDGVMCYRY